MGGATFSKSLIQFYVDGWGSVPSLLFDLKPNCGGGNEDNEELFQKVPCMHCYTQCPQTCRRSSPTHDSAEGSWTLGQVWVGLLWGHCSFLMGPGEHKVLFVPPSVCFPSPVLSSGGFMLGLMATSSKRAYAIPRSAAPIAPAPEAVHC